MELFIYLTVFTGFQNLTVIYMKVGTHIYKTMRENRQINLSGSKAQPEDVLDLQILRRERENIFSPSSNNRELAV